MARLHLCVSTGVDLFLGWGTGSSSSACASHLWASRLAKTGPLVHLHSLTAGLPQAPDPTPCGNASNPAASATVRLLWHEVSPGAHVLWLRVSSFPLKQGAAGSCGNVGQGPSLAFRDCARSPAHSHLVGQSEDLFRTWQDLGKGRWPPAPT